MVYIMTVITINAAAAAKSLQLCPTLCDPIDGSPPGSPVHGILQARTLEWVAVSFSRHNAAVKSLQSCLTLSDPLDSSPPGSSVHGILQARILEWVAISFSSTEHIHNIIHVHILSLSLSFLARLCEKLLVAQPCLTPCDPINCSPRGFSVLRIFQSGILEWVTVSFSRDCSRPRD